MKYDLTLMWYDSDKGYESSSVWKNLVIKELQLLMPSNKSRDKHEDYSYTADQIEQYGGIHIPPAPPHGPEIARFESQEDLTRFLLAWS